MIDDTPITRRRLLVAGGGAAAAASLPGLLAPEPAGARAARRWITRSTFTSRVGQTFRMRLESGGRMGLRLVAVTGDDRSFDLVFHSSSSILHPQATRQLWHPELGRTQLFVVPMQAPWERLRYVVSINRDPAAARMPAPPRPSRPGGSAV